MSTIGRYTGLWDCHVHCFDPERYPYKTSRSYTPKSAPLGALIQNLVTENVMLVQATIEGDMSGLLAHLEAWKNAKDVFQGRVRGTILADTPHFISTLSNMELDRMHILGVRCIRLHGSYGGSGNDIEWVRTQLESLACLKPVRDFGWSISAQLPLKTWSRLKTFILKDTSLANTSIIIDHIGCVGPSDYGSPALDDILELLQSGRVYIKISALHRRSPKNITAMEPIVRLLSKTSPQALLWGSDWPHVDTLHNDFETSPLEGVQASIELATVESWLTPVQRHQMLIENPERLFGM